ncbi:MAG: hypothetical protein OEM93_05260 [Rhodospirillales bacterium]|nr:hypothetical protein [Rhodospirillales bacterium]
MSNNQFSRNLRLLASTSVLACALIGAPVSVRIQLEGPGWHLEAPVMGSGLSRHVAAEWFAPGATDLPGDAVAEAKRRKALARLGLEDGTPYESPVLLTLSQAQAASGSGDGDGGSGGDGDGGSGGDGDGGSGGDGGASGGGDSDGDGASGGASGPSEGTPGTSGTAGTSGGSFGDVEQVGPSLSEDEEAAAILTGWQ